MVGARGGGVFSGVLGWSLSSLLDQEAGPLFEVCVCGAMCVDLGGGAMPRVWAKVSFPP